jgi:integrase
MSPYEFDTALDESKESKPHIIKAHNNDSESAKAIQLFREEVSLNYAGNWAEFFANWKKSQDKQFEYAKQERAALHKQNQELLRKMDSQSTLLGEQTLLLGEQKLLLNQQTAQIQQLLDELKQRLNKERAAEEKRAKRKAAKKRAPRDAITPDEFQTLIQSIPLSTFKTARLKVAFTLLYLTGLRVSNLLTFSVLNLNELITKQSTLVHIIKGGGSRKIIVPSQAKRWFKQIMPEIHLLTANKEPNGVLFSNRAAYHTHQVQRTA